MCNTLCIYLCVYIYEMCMWILDIHIWSHRKFMWRLCRHIYLVNPWVSSYRPILTLSVTDLYIYLLESNFPILSTTITHPKRNNIHILDEMKEFFFPNIFNGGGDKLQCMIPLLNAFICGENTCVMTHGETGTIFLIKWFHPTQFIMYASFPSVL